MKLNQEKIRDLAVSLLGGSPGGLRFAQLVDKIAAQSPNTPHGTITGTIRDLPARRPHEVSKPSRGLYVAAQAPEVVKKPVASSVCLEADYYSSFAEWLKNELDEATQAVTLGGTMGKKWGTPDVLGVYRPTAAQRFKFEPQLIAAEIKIDVNTSVTAFGQAAAYRLFASKSYIVMPTTMSEEDRDRLESLCMLFGVGFVQFALDKSNPQYTIRIRAQRFEPDMFYVNEFADRLHHSHPKQFEALFP